VIVVPVSGGVYGRYGRRRAHGPPVCGPFGVLPHFTVIARPEGPWRCLAMSPSGDVYYCHCEEAKPTKQPLLTVSHGRRLTARLSSVVRGLPRRPNGLLAMTVAWRKDRNPVGGFEGLRNLDGILMRRSRTHLHAFHSPEKGEWVISFNEIFTYLKNCRF